LMRLAGIPARVVIGYLGGEYNEFGHFFLVRQSDAHAWCEVWFADSGWQRIDPTSAVAPERINLGLNSSMRGTSTAGRTDGSERGNLTHRPFFSQFRLVWDSLNYAWDTRVLSFDSEAQKSFADSIGISTRGPLVLFVCVSIIACAFLAIYAAWMRLRARPAVDRVKAFYEVFCRKLARRGVQREPWEGPTKYSERAGQLLPNESNRIRQISETYIALRYSPKATANLFHAFAREVKIFPREPY
jgi:protein-glutamine gamma-glutamyltransferase